MLMKTRGLDEMPSINLTSMIDVVFLLIIFFMVGTQFTQGEREIALKRPGVDGLKPMVAPPDRQEIAVLASGAIAIDGREVTVDQLEQRLRAMRAGYPALRVLGRADGQVPYQSVASVYGAASRAGVSDLSTAMMGRAAPTR